LNGSNNNREHIIESPINIDKIPVAKNTKVEFHNNQVGFCITKSESGFYIGLNPGFKYQK
jgi:hypothetical protein